MPKIGYLRRTFKSTLKVGRTFSTATRPVVVAATGMAPANRARRSFPPSWDDEKVIDTIVDVARRPDMAPQHQQKNDRWWREVREETWKSW